MAYSVTPPSSFTSSSIPIGKGGTQVKKLASRPAHMRTSSSAVLAPAPSVERTTEDLSWKYSFSSSGVRRSLRTSPTGSPAVSEAFRRGPYPSGSLMVNTNTVVGFDLAQLPPHRPQPGSSSALPKTTPASSSAKPPRQGLLSRALSQESPSKQVLCVLPEWGMPRSAHEDASAFFPTVDPRPLKAAQAQHPVFYDPMVVTAYMLAASIHEGQQRKDGSPIIGHCLQVATILASMGLDASTVAASLLHEAPKGSDAYPGRLEEFMPRPVVQLVERVNVINEISQLYRNNRDRFDDEILRRMMVAMEDVKSVLIKLADRVHNMRTISALSHDKQVLLAQETLDIYSVVANRLGVWCLKAELEDLAFAVLHPEDYESLKAQVSARQDTAALEATIHKIKAGLEEKGVPYEDISGRPKNLWGIYQKMKAGNLTSLDQVYDVIALRVVLANKHDCYVARRVVQRTYNCMPNRSKDFIREIRRPNGYQSLHETMEGEGGLTMEVQIRTHKMHYVAEYGFAAHWKYKEKLSDEDQWLDKEVQYKKWLTTYKLGVHDKKIRASGSPPTDHSLKSLGMAYLDGKEQTMVDPFLKHDRFKLQLQPSKPLISVVLQTQNDITTKDVAVGTTASQISWELGLQNLPGYALIVNGRLPSSMAKLQCGDLVQVVPTGQALARSPGNLFRFSLQDGLSSSNRQEALTPA